jgi:hypothetical protein
MTDATIIPPADSTAGGSAAAGGAAGGVATVDTSWLGQDAKPEITEYVKTKGFKGPAAVAEAYMNAERALSSRTFDVPKTEDQASWTKIRQAMGVPESADKYDLGEIGKTLNPEALKAWTPLFHKLGIPNAAAAELMGSVMAQAKTVETQRETAFQQTSAREAEAVKAKWGDSYDANLDLARRGMTKIGELIGGMPDGALLALEKAIGTEKLLNLGLVFGRHTVEAGFVTSDGQHKGMTKASAQQARQVILTDPVKNQALYNGNHPQHQAVKREWIELGNIING